MLRWAWTSRATIVEDGGSPIAHGDRGGGPRTVGAGYARVAGVGLLAVRQVTGDGRLLALAAQVSNAERAIAQALACERWPAVGGRPGERALDEETYARATGSTGRGCGPGGSPRRLRGRRRVRRALLPTLRRDGSLQADPRRRLAGTPQAEITVVHRAGKAGVDRDSHGGPQSKPAGSWRIATRRTPKPRVPAGERRRRAARGGARGARLNGLPKAAVREEALPATARCCISRVPGASPRGAGCAAAGRRSHAVVQRSGGRASPLGAPRTIRPPVSA
jgi:hypothetical protein